MGIYKKKLRDGVRYYYRFMHQYNPYHSEAGYRLKTEAEGAQYFRKI